MRVLANKSLANAARTTFLASEDFAPKAKIYLNSDKADANQESLMRLMTATSAKAS